MPRTNVNRIGRAIDDFNDHVRGELRRQHKNQGDLAVYLGLQRSTVNRKVCGRDGWTLKEYLSIKEFFGEE